LKGGRIFACRGRASLVPVVFALVLPDISSIPIPADDEK
jgi:hypothetical protein